MAETSRLISAFEARTHLGEVLDYIRYTKKPCLVERHGTLVAAILDIETFRDQTRILQYNEWIRLSVEQLKKHYEPKKIILFGSVATGEPKDGSDIDLFIIKDTNKRALDRIDEAMEFIDPGIPAELHIYTQKEVDERSRLGDPFIRDILENGKVLYEKQK